MVKQVGGVHKFYLLGFNGTLSFFVMNSQRMIHNNIHRIPML